MDVLEKLTILTDSAKYDVACTSSGSERPGDETGLGSTVAAGLCHAFAADGRCISLLKVLLSNCCVYDCKYCVNRVTNDVPRAAFTPRELADLTIGFYRRNYIEGLFLSSAVLRSPDYTMEQMIGVLELLRERFAHGQPVTLGALEGTLSREEMEHLTMVVNRKDMTVSEQAMDDYIRTIEEEYTRTHCRGGDTLLQMARQKKETGGYGG